MEEVMKGDDIDFQFNQENHSEHQQGQNFLNAVALNTLETRLVKGNLRISLNEHEKYLEHKLLL